MRPSADDTWTIRVSKIFSARPRVGTSDTLWMPRPEEAKLRASLLAEGVHVCLYGPSGSGKTSLVRTVLSRIGARGKAHVYARLSSGTTWNSFKSQVIENHQSSISLDDVTGVKIGISNLLPYLEFTSSFKRHALGNSKDRATIVEAVTLTALAQALAERNLILVVDDVNFASDELLRTLTDLAKEITDIPTETRAKIVFVGADDIYVRINDLQPNLRERIDDIALGSVEDPSDSRRSLKRDAVWKFLSDSLDRLGLARPEKDPLISREELARCLLAIEHAADGLPKTIVRLGRHIAELGRSRSRVSVADIVPVCEEMTRRNFRNYRSSFRTLLAHLRKSDLLPHIIVWMFRRGASRIHEVDELAEDFRSRCTYFTIESLLLALVDLKFIVISGRGGAVFFAHDPLFAHTLGVALTSPAVCGIDASYFGVDNDSKQLFLELSGSRDPENRQTLRP